MTNLYDYLTWRGDLRFEDDPLNEVDNLIFAWLSYVDFADIIPEGEEEITIGDARDKFFATHERLTRVDSGTYNNVTLISPQLLDKLADTRRFRDIALVNFVSIMDAEKAEQFAALTALIDDQTAYIAFRGTDTSYAGWKEDFRMSFMPAVPSQMDAHAYLEALLGVGDRALYVGGHSKGGNLAVYAAAKADEKVQSRIKMIYNNDGPGFSPALLSSEGYQRIADRIKTILPRSSVIGLLFEHAEDYTVVSSTSVGMLQHNALNWEVKGPGFVALPELSKSSSFFDQTARDWMASLSDSQREAFVSALFSVLENTGTKDFDELNKDRMGAALALARTLTGLSSEERGVLMDVIRKLAAASAENLRQKIAGRVPLRRRDEQEGETEAE